MYCRNRQKNTEKVTTSFIKTLKIIKIGGNIIDDDNALSGFLLEFAKINEPKIFR